MRITDLLPGGAEEAAKVTVLIDAKDQSIVSYDKATGIFTIRKGTPGVTATIRKTNYADVKLTFVINEIDAEAQRVSNTGIVSGSVKEGFKLDGLKKGVTGTATQIKITKPVPGTKFEIIPVSDKAAQYVTCEEVKDTNNGDAPTGVFQFTWKADATADVVYNIKADGYKAVTVTISAAKLSKRALLEAFKAANDAIGELEVYGENATLTLEKETNKTLSLQIKEGSNDAKDVTYTYSDTTGAVVKMEKASSRNNNAYTFTAQVEKTTTETEPTLTIKYPGYEDATVKVKVVETKEQDGGVISLWNGETEIAAATPYVLENLVVGATTGTDVTFRTTADVSGSVTTALTVTPSGHDQEAVEVTVSGGKATFKAKKYVGTSGAQFTFKAKTGATTYKTGTIKVTTAEVGKLIDYLPKKQDGFTVTDNQGTKTAALALSVGNPVTIRFSDKIDIKVANLKYASGSDDVTEALKIQELGGGYFKFEAKTLAAGNIAITFDLTADGYTKTEVTVTITSLETYLKTAGSSDEVKLENNPWKLTVPVDTFEHTSGEILAKESLPDRFNVVLAKTSTSKLTDPVSDYAEFSYQKDAGTIKIKPKKAVAEIDGLVLRLSATGYGNFDVSVVLEEVAMKVAKPSPEEDDVQYTLDTSNNLKAIAVPYDATTDGEYTFTVKGTDNQPITGLVVAPKTGETGVTGISAAYDNSNGTVTITVPAGTDGTKRGDSQVLTLTAPGYTPVKVTVSVKDLLSVEAPEGIEPDAVGTTSYTIASLTTGEDNKKIFTVTVGEDDVLTAGTPSGSGKATATLGDKTANKYTITLSATEVSTDNNTFTYTCPGYDDVVIVVSKTEAPQA